MLRMTTRMTVSIRDAGLAILVISALGGCAREGTQTARSGAGHRAVANSPARAACEEVSLRCGRTPSLAFDSNGRLWAAFEKDGHVHITYSDDSGATFAGPVRVNQAAEAIESNGEGRPKIAIGRAGAIYVSWTRMLAEKFTGEIRFSRSVDGGRTFEPPRTMNDDGLAVGHRFDSLYVNAAEEVYLAWIDKRDLEAARSRGDGYRGAALYYAVSTDRGASFSGNRRVADHVCECCRIGITEGPDGGAAILWRHIFGPNVRDHAFAVLGTEGASSPPRRATREGWQLDGCPHHGPAIASAGEGSYHMTWFTGAEQKPAIYYGHLDAGSGEVRQLAKVATGASASHPDIVDAGERLILAWKQVDGERTEVHAIVSTDGGATWSIPRALAATRGPSDHPFLLGHRGEAFLSWHTDLEGLRVVAVPRES